NFLGISGVSGGVSAASDVASPTMRAITTRRWEFMRTKFDRERTTKHTNDTKVIVGAKSCRTAFVPLVYFVVNPSESTGPRESQSDAFRTRRSKNRPRGAIHPFN